MRVFLGPYYEGLLRKARLESVEDFVIFMSTYAGIVSVPQTLQELLEANQGYLNWLHSMGAAKAEHDFTESLRPLATAAEYAYAPYVEYERPEILFQPPMTEIGDVTVSPYTHRSMSLAQESQADPLNLVFAGNAEVSRVAKIFAYRLFPPELHWQSTVVPLYNCAETQWVYLRKGDMHDFLGMKYTIAMGGCLSNPRCHIRLFDGGHDEQLGEFTLANVHYEHLDVSKMNHVVDDWDRAQAFVQHLFQATPYCESVRMERFQANERIQNIPNDGFGTIIELE